MVSCYIIMNSNEDIYYTITCTTMRKVRLVMKQEMTSK